MDFNKVAGKAKELIDKRGGPESVKEDALELKDIAGSDENLVDKAKDAVQALKEPGAPKS